MEKDKISIQEKIDDSEKKAMIMLKDLENFDEVRKDCDVKLASMKKDFNEMKRKIEIINVEENKLKEALDDAVSQRENQKSKCDKIKKSIKENKDAFKKSVAEFGSDQDLDCVDQAAPLPIDEQCQIIEDQIKQEDS